MRPSASLENQMRSPETAYAPPPYSWTRERTLNGAGVTSTGPRPVSSVRPVTSARRPARTRTLRPPSPGRPSSQAIRPASRLTDESRMVSATMASGVIGDGHAPYGSVLMPAGPASRASSSSSSPRRRPGASRPRPNAGAGTRYMAGPDKGESPGHSLGLPASPPGTRYMAGPDKGERAADPGARPGSCRSASGTCTGGVRKTTSGGPGPKVQFGRPCGAGRDAAATAPGAGDRTE